MDRKDYQKGEAMLLAKIKQMLGIYKPGYEYWVPLRDIKIRDDFARSWIGQKKWTHKREYYLRTGTFESQIVLGKDFLLLDGYSSYKIARWMGLEKVPVIFTSDDNGGKSHGR